MHWPWHIEQMYICYEMCVSECFLRWIWCWCILFDFIQLILCCCGCLQSSDFGWHRHAQAHSHWPHTHNTVFTMSHSQYMAQQKWQAANKYALFSRNYWKSKKQRESERDRLLSIERRQQQQQESTLFRVAGKKMQGITGETLQNE